MVRTYDVLADFGSQGVPASSVNLDYRLDDTYGLSESLRNGILRAWEEYSKSDERLSNSLLINLRGVGNTESGTSLCVGLSRFMDYYAMKEFSDKEDDRVKYGFSEEDVKSLVGEVNVLSSFPAILLEGDSGVDNLLMGVKGRETLKEGRLRLSFPGAGYLRADVDTSVSDGVMSVNSLQSIVGRKIGSETGIMPYELDEANVLAIVKDTYSGSHKNPGIMSVVKSGISVEELLERKGGAEDSWEHEGPYVIVPLVEEIISSFIDSDTSLGNVPIPEKYACEISGLGNTRTIETTGKSMFMLFLAGRRSFGSEFYDGLLEKYHDSLVLE